MKLAILLVLAACGRDTKTILEAPPRGSAAAKPAAPSARPKIAALTTTLPTGWTSQYDAGIDMWIFTSPKLADGRTTIAHLAQLSAAVAPSPEDYLALREHLWDKGTTAAIVGQQKLADGFAMTVNVKPAIDPTREKRETYVLRHVGATWLDCQCEWVPDDAIRDQVIALCSSAKL